MTNDRNKELAELAALLDGFGADRSKWPAERNAAVSDLLAENTGDDAAREMLEEHLALDRVLDKAPAGGVTPDLKARILAAATQKTGIANDPEAADNIVHFETARRSRRPRSVLALGDWRNAAAASALAASFMLGLYLGVSGLAAPAIDEALQLASGSLAGQTYETADPLGATDFGEDLL